MPNSITLPLDHGCVTGTDPTLLKPGQLQEAEGVAYVPGDPAVHKVGGRSLFNTVAPASADVNGINFVSFDSNSVDYIAAQIGGNQYAAPTTTAAFGTIRTGLTASAKMIDMTKFADEAFFVNGTDANWVMRSNQTGYDWGMTEQSVAPTSAFSGTGLTGTYTYWTTEVNPDGVESASTATLVVNPANQGVDITKPATINSSATLWRIYRTIAGGSFPIGWRVATKGIGTATHSDTMSDSALVLLTPYEIISVNDIPESQNFPPPIFRSVATFEGSLCGVADRSLYYSETGTPHYFPATYVIPFRPMLGGQARCTRTVNKVLMVFFDHNTFRVNTLPKAADSFFDAGVVQERIANYGTPSPLGACSFSGWGGSEMVFFWDRNGPMITDGNVFDSAVDNIDAATVPAASLPTVVCVDNPTKFRVEVTYLDANDDYRALHFYYDSSKITQERGFPELIWTGPHLVPGPGTYGVLNGVGVVWTGSRDADGFVYQEDVGYSDAALLVDASGTVNFRMRTPRVFGGGDINTQATVTRIYVSKAADGTGNYTVTLNSWNEGDTNQPVVTTHPISATLTGTSSNDYNRGAQCHDVRVVRDDAVFMPPINNLTLKVSDVGELAKTNRR